MAIALWPKTRHGKTERLAQMPYLDEQWTESGLSQKQFARDNQIKYTFTYWLDVTGNSKPKTMDLFRSTSQLYQAIPVQAHPALS